MAHNGFKVIDSDMHVLEPGDLWEQYIDAAYRDRAPRGLARAALDIAVQVEGKNLSRPRSYNRTFSVGLRENLAYDENRYAFAIDRGWDATSQIQAMDAEGIDLAVLFPSRGLFVMGLDIKEARGTEGIDADFASAIARAYNDWLHDFCAQYPDRLFGAAMIAPHDVAEAILEIRRCVHEFGFKSTFFLPGMVGHRNWYDPIYDPLWQECQRLNVPAVFHGGGFDYLTPDFGLGIFDWWMTRHTFAHAMGPMFACVSMIAGGVFERFPDLRAGFLEGNCSWAPWLLERLDGHYKWRGYLENPELKMMPSDYFRRNCYLSVEPEETASTFYVQRFGDENVVFSTDYPHPDSRFPTAVDTLLSTLTVPDESKRKFLWDNSMRLYHLPT